MSKSKILGIVVGCAVFFMTGCATKLQNNKGLPKHDEVLIYKLPYDLTYLRTVEALEHANGWELEETEKEKGTITVRNLNYERLDDSDRRVATFVLKRLSRQETSIELAPESRQVVEGGKLFDKIAEFVSKEL